MDVERFTYEQLKEQLDRALRAEGKLFGEAFERGSDLEDINEMLEDEIEYRRELEESLDAVNDQWFSLVMENQRLRTALEQAKQENDQMNDKLSFAIEMVGALVLSAEWEDMEDD